MKAIITKLQDMQPLYLDATKESYIMKLEKGKYIIENNYYGNEPRVIDYRELQWFLRVNKDNDSLTDLAASLKGTRQQNIIVDTLTKWESYNDYLEYKISYETLEIETKKEVLQEKISMSKNVMQALLLAKKEVNNIMGTINQAINFSIQALDYSFVVITALILSLFFSSKVNLETNKDNKTRVLSYSKNIPSVKRFYFVLKLVNISFITYLVTIKGIDNLLIG